MGKLCIQGEYGELALKNDGTVVTWGSNIWHQYNNQS